jgi:predicted amidohydrolase
MAAVKKSKRKAGSRDAIRASSARLRIALAQVDATPSDISANLTKAKQIIHDNRNKVDLLVFPEYTLTGYITGTSVYDRALRTDDELFQDLVKSTTDITVAISFIEETTAFRFYNSLAIISHGQILHVHRKIYLVNYGVFEERRHFSTGPSHQCVDIGGFRVAPFICSDAWNPGLVHLAAADLAHIMMFSACSPTQGLGSRLSTRESWKRMNQFYASMYGVYVLFVNRVGSDEGLFFWGGSEIIDPFGKTIAVSNTAGEEIVRAEINLAEVREARTILHTVRDEDLELIQRRLDKVRQSHYSSD